MKPVQINPVNHVRFPVIKKFFQREIPVFMKFTGRIRDEFKDYRFGRQFFQLPRMFF
jgi:hypothetical protein